MSLVDILHFLIWMPNSHFDGVETFRNCLTPEASLVISHCWLTLDTVIAHCFSMEFLLSDTQGKIFAYEEVIKTEMERPCDVSWYGLAFS